MSQDHKIAVCDKGSVALDVFRKVEQHTNGKVKVDEFSIYQDNEGVHFTMTVEEGFDIGGYFDNILNLMK